MKNTIMLDMGKYYNVSVKQRKGEISGGYCNLRSEENE